MRNLVRNFSESSGICLAAVWYQNAVKRRSFSPNGRHVLSFKTRNAERNVVAPAQKAMRCSRSRDTVLPCGPSLFSELLSEGPVCLAEKIDEIRDFSELPEALVVAVLLNLSVEDICRCSCTCRAFNRIVTKNCVWKKYCQVRWNQRTEPSQWLISPYTSHIPGLPQPKNYRSLSVLLSQLDYFIGFWRGPADPVTGQRDLFKFLWMSDCIACCNIASDPDQDVMYMGPRYSITGEIVDGFHCILRDYRQSEWRRGCSTNAAAVASVAVGLLSDTSAEMSTSFETGMMRYIQSTVRSKKKKSRRCQGPVMVPYVYHFTRLFIPTPTKHTWLTGLWSRTFHTTSVDQSFFEAILVEYDYSGRKAQISSKWVGGTHPPPSGSEMWKVSARPTVGHPSSSLEDLKYEGSGCVWDEDSGWFVVTLGTLEVICKNCILFRWLQLEPPEDGCITYQRLVDNEIDV